jgi:hypothetical protein
MQHENLHTLQWMQRHPTWAHETLSSPHHEYNEGGESPWGLKVGQKCNVTSQGPTNGGGPTWCTSQRIKHMKPNEKKKDDWVGRQPSAHFQPTQELKHA